MKEIVLDLKTSRISEKLELIFVKDKLGNDYEIETRTRIIYLINGLNRQAKKLLSEDEMEDILYKTLPF